MSRSIGKSIFKRLLLFAIIYIVFLMIASHSHADTEFWGISNVGKDDSEIKIEINADGCITSFTLPKKKLENDENIMAQMLDKAEKKQRAGCGNE